MLPIDSYEDKKTYRRFVKKIVVDMNSLCWLWNGAKSDRGYGKFRLGDKTISAHRMAYMVFVGEIPKGMHVCHKCDNPICVNPSHLFAGTHQDNMADMHNKGRWKSPNYGQHLKLNQQMADIIKSDPRPNTHIAKDWEVSRSLVSGIKNGRVWASSNS